MTGLGALNFEWSPAIVFLAALVAAILAALLALLLRVVWFRRGGASRQRTAEENPKISYSAVFYGGNHWHITITEPPEPAIRFPRGSHSPDDQPTFVRFRPSDFTLLDSFNVTSFTDNGTGDFTFTFGRNLRLQTLACHAMPPTPSTFKAVAGVGDDPTTVGSIRIVFDGEEPEIVALRFDDAHPPSHQQAPPPPPRLPEYEAEKKLRVIDAFLEVLQSDAQKIIDDGPRLTHWWNAIKDQNNYPNFGADLAAYSRRIKALRARLAELESKNPEYLDIILALQPTPWDLVNPGVGHYLVAYQAAILSMKPDAPREALELLVLKPEQAFAKAVDSIKTWQAQTRKNLITLRRQISP